MPITLPVEAIADNRSFDRIADRAEKRFAKAGQESGQAFAKSLDDAASKADPKSVDRWTKAYDKVADSAGKVRVEEAKLADLRDRGAANTRLISQSEALERARRAEARATREASQAYRDLEQSASGAESAFDKFRNAAKGNFGEAGEDAANNFLTGFSGASALTRIASAAGPVGLALAGVATLGLIAGKKLADQIEIGMASLNMKDTFAARIGVDSASMERYGSAAGRAFTNSWGASVEENLGVVQFAVQGGLIDADATEADIQRVIEQIQTVSTLIGEDSQAIARGVRNFIKTGMVDSTEEALDLVVAASQRGLNISGDLLDTFEEYGTKFRDVGLSGQDALGLINQLWEAGIRNTDVAADALKEFAISAVDGSDSTRDAFAALGFNADEMAQRFAAGGGTARDAFGEVLQALNSISDPLQQEIVGTALFKTKWEDAGDAIKGADLDTAASELGDVAGATQAATDRIDEHTSGWGALKRQIDQTFMSMKEWLADTAIGRFLNQGIPDFLGSMIEPVPGVTPGYTNTYPGQVVAPAVPGAGGAITPPSTGAIQGDGTFLENLITGAPGMTAPPGLAGPAGPDTPVTRIDPVPMTPGGSGGAAGGGGGGITLPYPAEYGAPPNPGESDEQYQARMADILAQHNLAEARASLTQIEADNTADATAVTAANNALIEAQMRANQSAQKLQESLRQTPGINAPFAPGYAEGPRPGQTAAQYSAESSFFEAQQKSAQATAEYEQLLASGTATTTELTEAHNELVEATRNENEALLRLSDTSTKTTEKLGEIGAQLDADFGISGGLAGIADNITRFVASLAMAPVIGALRGVQASTGVDASKSGSGLAGVVGAMMGLGGTGQQAAAIGGSPAFQQQSAIATPGIGGGGSAPSEAQVKQIAAQFGLSVTSEDRPGDKGYHGQGMALDLSNGSGNTAEMEAFASYMAQNFGGSLKELIYSSPTFGSNIKNGKPAPGTSVYDSGTLAEHRNHVHIAAAWGDQMAATMSGIPAAIGQGGSGGVARVFVVNMPGSGSAGLSAGSTGGLGASSSAGSGSLMSSSKSDIARYIAQKALGAGYSASDAQAFVAQALGESDLDPAAFGPTTGDASGGASGVFQFTPATWADFGGGGDPMNAKDNIDAYFRLFQARDPGQGDIRSRIATASVGGPAVPANNAPWNSYMQQASGLLGGAAPTGGGAGTGALGPGMGGLPQSMGGGEMPSTVGGITPAGGRGEGGLGVAGGLMGAAMSALSSAAGAGGMAVNGMAPGAGAAISAAADIGIKLANRGAQFAGQAAGIGVGGLLETFLPVDSELADPMNSWFGRVIGGMMGAAPNLPNMAGQAANAPQGQGQGAQAPGADGKPPITVNYTNNQATEDRAGADLTNHLMAMNTGPGQ